MRAQRVQSRAARQGFDWPNAEGALDKVEEEFAELRQAQSDQSTEAIEDEFGDLLFSVVNTARFLQINPEDALRRSVDKFERRFRAIESELNKSNRSMRDTALSELDELWDEIKRREHT